KFTTINLSSGSSNSVTAPAFNIGSLVGGLKFFPGKKSRGLNIGFETGLIVISSDNYGGYLPGIGYRSNRFNFDFRYQMAYSEFYSKLNFISARVLYVF
ncbi:MAG: hypothetical protein ACKO13_10675, partial [Cytophagales bacterium]